QAVAQRDPVDVRWREELEAAYAAVAFEEGVVGDPRAALAAARAARDVAAGPARAGPGHPPPPYQPPPREDTLCTTLRGQGAVDEALAECRGGREVAARLVGIDAGNSTWLAMLGNLDKHQGQVEELAGDLDAALASYRRALATGERLAERD